MRHLQTLIIIITFDFVLSPPVNRFVRDVSPKEIFSHEDFNFMSNENENEKSAANDTIATQENEIEHDNDLYQMQKAKKNRVRRQSPGRQSLCQTNFQFITPKAALNSQGKLNEICIYLHTHYVFIWSCL